MTRSDWDAKRWKAWESEESEEEVAVRPMRSNPKCKGKQQRQNHPSQQGGLQLRKRSRRENALPQSLLLQLPSSSRRPGKLAQRGERTYGIRGDAVCLGRKQRKRATSPHTLSPGSPCTTLQGSKYSLPYRLDCSSLQGDLTQ